ncbi:MAG: hypothetical protein A3K19_28250 [Lentisphaerae bacterium RIFOXYB12_FULL_65_16]|nr:MAG: hypothetical protein A3K18_19500 [Lentisphaerae bacterium RIFOXYA12_64_32]OGV85482.1 MAG: hypothetical protein A3K19_28250 [Lentisphaerae bacterium RIFOXYB12_FULL_65_16]
MHANADAADTPASFEWPPETSRALATRLRFVARHARLFARPTILDVGCGTGEHLTQYLARLLPRAHLIGMDPDAASISHAMARFGGLPNVRFTTSMPAGDRFDIVIASEVLEHVDSPAAFLAELRSLLKDDGVLLLTVPNGYGPSELTCLAQTLLHLYVLHPRRGANHTRPPVPSLPSPVRADLGLDTNASSFHRQFFTRRRLLNLFARNAWTPVACQARMFLHACPSCSLLDRFETLASLNVNLARLLPLCLASDWMFALRKDLSASPAVPPVDIRPGRLHRRRQLWHELRFGAASSSGQRGTDGAPTGA